MKRSRRSRQEGPTAIAGGNPGPDAPEEDGAVPVPPAVLARLLLVGDKQKNELRQLARPLG